MTLISTSSLPGVLLGTVVLACIGCGGESGSPKPPSAPKPPTAGAPAATVGPPPVASTESAGDASGWTVSTASSDPKTAEVGGLVFPKPVTWVWTTPSMRFRTLQYEVPGSGEGAGAAELVFSLFRGNDGGPTDMNIDRWVGQFRGENGGAPDSSVTTEDVGGLEIVRMEVTGAYQAMGQPAPRPGQKQLGAIIQAPGRRVFVRLVGPIETVEQAAGDFDAMLRGAMPAG